MASLAVSWKPLLASSRESHAGATVFIYSAGGGVLSNTTPPGLALATFMAFDGIVCSKVLIRNMGMRTPGMAMGFGRDLMTMATRGSQREITMRFLAEPMDVNFGGKVHGGAVMKWIDQAGYACAVGWSGLYCVTLYVGGDTKRQFLRILRPCSPDL